MVIYLIRHAEAEAAIPGINDSDRSLSEKGKNALLNNFETWKKFIPKFSIIISSPYLRAIQTAEIIAHAYKYPLNKILKNKLLVPGCKSESIIEIANEHNIENIAFIGHQPDLSRHVVNLTSSGNFNIGFSPGTIAGLSFSGRVRPVSGILNFLIPIKN